MDKQWKCGLLIIVLLLFFSLYARFDLPILLSDSEAIHMGRQIWRNECGGKIEGLTSWNEGEEFASLGIGHFIWYPEGKTGPFKQTFPDLLRFFREQGIELPVWLQEAQGCPWPARQPFLAAQNSLEMIQLRALLADHVPLQILFMVERLKQALPKMAQALPNEEQEHLFFQFYRLSSTLPGIYALLDYINFKGEGLAMNGEGWGALQVLQRMSGTEMGRDALEEFVIVAKEVLSLRVEKASPERNEQRWIKGWHNRLNSYLDFSL